MTIRPMTPAENTAVAALIRQSLEDEGLALPGTAYFDPQLDDLADHYDGLVRSGYFVCEDDGQVIGCGGFGPISDKICELQKLYVAKTHRGKGYASQLLAVIETEAGLADYQSIYLESSTKLVAALKLYEKMGYRHLAQPLTQETGHYLMDVWMLKGL